MARFFDQLLLLGADGVLEAQDAVLLVPLLLIDQALNAQKLELVRAERLHLFAVALAEADRVFTAVQALSHHLVVLLLVVLGAMLPYRLEIVFAVERPGASRVVVRRLVAAQFLVV